MHQNLHLYRVSQSKWGFVLRGLGWLCFWRVCNCSSPWENSCTEILLHHDIETIRWQPLDKHVDVIINGITATGKPHRLFLESVAITRTHYFTIILLLGNLVQ